MPDLVLTGRQQSALRQILAAEAVPGQSIPEPWLLSTIDRLVPCDILGAGCFDTHGRPVELIEVPRGVAENLPAHDDGGPYLVGFLHWPEHPVQAAECGALPGVDAVSIGFRNGPEHVSQIWFDRTRIPFSDTELALFHLLVPTFKRLLRGRPTTHLPACLTAAERNVLAEVAVGNGNAEIAANLCVAQSTVRKHLEHAYRKLGVTNRVAAVVAFTGRELQDSRIGE